MGLAFWIIRRCISAVCFAVTTFFLWLVVDVWSQGRTEEALGIAIAAFIAGALIWPGRPPYRDYRNNTLVSRVPDNGSDDDR